MLSGWSRRVQGSLLLVEFDPQDAVSVPTDCSFQKLRVSKYKVIADISDTRKELDKAVYQANKPIYGSNDCCEDEDCDFECDDDIDQGQAEDDDWDVEDTARLSIRNYVEQKLEDGVQPSVKQIRSLQVVRNAGLNTSQVADILDQEGFELEDDEDKSLTDKVVLEKDSGWNF